MECTLSAADAPSFGNFVFGALLLRRRQRPDQRRPTLMAAMGTDARLQHMAKLLAQQFRMPAVAVEQVLADRDNWTTLQSFFAAGGEPTRLLFFRQSREVLVDGGSAYEQPNDADAELVMSTGVVERQKGRVVYFCRAQPAQAVQAASVHTDLSFGVVGPNSLEHMQVRSCGLSCRRGRRRFCVAVLASHARGTRRERCCGRRPLLTPANPVPVYRRAALPSAGDAVAAVHATAHAGGPPVGAGCHQQRREAGVFQHPRQIRRHHWRSRRHAQFGLHAAQAG